jgi:hypothetical protein
MSTRKQRIEAEAVALWRTLFHEPPPAAGECSEILELMLRRLPELDYERLSSPCLRRSALTWPKRVRDSDSAPNVSQEQGPG